MQKYPKIFFRIRNFQFSRGICTDTVPIVMRTNFYCCSNCLNKVSKQLMVI